MSDDDGVRDAGYDDFLDAIEDGDPFFLQSPSGNGWLPPQIRDPETGEGGLEEQPLPDTGEILTMTTVYVSGPTFVDDTPYVVAIAEFGPVRMTGQVRGVDPDDVGIGQAVEIGVDRTETTGERVIVFDPI
ncbi:nucleic acid-binding protein [Halobacteriales archaeon QS_4_66_20]|nr:MAG: nucleic acid-binding protein [Halobacteriales archaeon QS_4_66_20]